MVLAAMQGSNANVRIPNVGVMNRQQMRHFADALQREGINPSRATKREQDIVRRIVREILANNSQS